MTKLALVLGGHASLGAYTAGAVMEVLRALEDAGTQEAPPVSVVVGSGSGALCAGLAARSLVVNPGMIPWMERIWVDAVDARHLLNPDRLDRSALLDPSPLEEITLHTVAGEAASDDRVGAALGRELRLGIPLTPVPGGEPAGGGPEDARRERHADATFRLDAGHGATDPVWERIRRACLAATAAPLAFPPRGLGAEILDRSPAEQAEETEEGWFVGGGPVRPRPLETARALMRDAPGATRGPWRALVVDPGEGARPGGGPPAASRDPWWGLDLLLRGGLPADFAADWSEARDGTRRVEMLRALVDRLPEVHGRLDDPDAVGLGRHIGALAEHVAETEVARQRAAGGRGGSAADPVMERLDDGLRRIQEHPAYTSALDEVESRAGRTRLAKLIYVLEAVSDLDGVDPVRLHRIRPPEGEGLAGRGLAGFGGFASRAWRRHDFVAGRRDARRALEEELSDVLPYAPEGASAYDPPPVRGIEAAVDGPVRRRLASRLGTEVDRMLERVRPGGLRGVFFGLARPALRDELVSRALRALDPTSPR